MSRSAYKHVLSVVAIAALVSACGNPAPDARLSHIDALADSTLADGPRRALAALDSIDGATLGDADRHYYDFLTIKARDKAYVTHTSDSLILDVIDYYSEHRADVPPYAEVLYYGGRVYSDLGDFPTALSYFRQAVDAMDGASLPYPLRCNILSQTGRLLSDICLFNESVPYIEQAIKIEREHGDTVKWIYDLQLLGNSCLREGDYKAAEKHLKSAIAISANFPDVHKATSQMHLAEVKYELGEIDSAVVLINGVPDRVNDISRNNALWYASNIYLRAKMPDSAYINAERLVHSDREFGKIIGYQNILSPDLRDYLPKDSIEPYFNTYWRLIKRDYDQNQARLIINQQSKYNYTRHEMARQQAEQRNRLLEKGIFASILLILSFLVITLYIKNKNKAHIIELRAAISNIEKLKTELNNAYITKNGDSLNAKESAENEKPDMSVPQKEQDKLRDQLRTELLELYNNPLREELLPPAISQSEAYRKMRDCIQNKISIVDDDTLWQEIEQAVLSSSPKFKSNLNLLTSHNLTQIDMRTALLIKCHIKPSQMRILLGRSNGAIVSRREMLCVKIFDKKMGTKVIDAIIRSI